MSHINIPIFVVHLGCPHTCVFCNQRTITGQNTLTPNAVDNAVKNVLSSLNESSCHDIQIAFFGGSFTAIERPLMLSLLQRAKNYIDQGLVGSIRLSTRPDAIDDEILSLLADYGVKTVELGIQSSSDAVLSACERGHTAKDAETACRLIKARGFELVGQMMIGLPAATQESELQTANDMIAWGIDAARIYPTVVFADTALAVMMQKGTYKELTTEDAIERSSTVYTRFLENGIDVIRIGLCENEGLHSENTIGGAHHPALGELIKSRHYLTVIQNEINKIIPPPSATVVIEAPQKLFSQVIGQKKKNLRTLEEAYPNCRFLFQPSPTLTGKDVKIFIKEN